MQVSLRLKEPLIARLDSLSKKSGRSKTALITESIIEHLAELELVYNAEETLKRVKSGKEKTYPLEEVKRENGLI
jgi:RHH-type rel operon transcriptional repressor/antitoxin RelB